MLRRQSEFVKSILSRCGPEASLHQCYKKFYSYFKSNQGLVSKLANDGNFRSHNLTNEEWNKFKFSGMTELIFLNLCAGRHKKVLHLANRIAQDPSARQIVTLDLYLLVLQLLAHPGVDLEEHGHDVLVKASLAIQLFSELLQIDCPESSLKQAFDLVLNCASKSTDFTQLVPLRILFEHLNTQFNDDRSELRFLATVLNMLLNSEQYISALEHLRMCQTTYTSSLQKKIMYHTFPLRELVEAMCSRQDCSSLTALLQDLSEENVTYYLPLRLWLQCLHLGLSLNNYALTKLVYERIVINGVDQNITMDGVVLENKLAEFEKQNVVFGTLTDTTIDEIVRLFASNGDVDLCLSLIERHYVHKQLKGQKGLSKELCIDIVRAYCFHQDSASDSEDSSIKQVIDVIQNFITKQDGEFIYTDISDALLHKLHHYRVYDYNVQRAARRENIVYEASSEEAEDESILFKKVRGPLVSSSKQGNVLSNITIMKEFIQDHTSYILSKDYGQETLQLFLNCVFDHVNKYQNLSGLIAAFEALNTIDINFASKWIDLDLLQIMSHSLSKSSANVVSGFHLYQYFSKITTLSEEAMIGFIFSALRTPDNIALLEFYLYQYLLMFSGTVSELILERITSWSLENSTGMPLAKFLMNLKNNPDWQLEWKKENFITSSSQFDIKHSLDSKYSEIDLLNLHRLQKILPLD
ncbi:hypothetical protein PUMCH_001013 [Australozyma saopauloensis]|uniref:Uncharacterized protein n=1 Tax=Australozyma saopauloensis TaxID=291208 RepID=A0AAX4H5Q3_9ASCO|nr:hypothetical protein PUMCH_001013 [[Candida] saopauloensis]